MYGLALAADAPIDGLVPIVPPNTTSDCEIFLTRGLPHLDAAFEVIHEGDIDPESRVATVAIRRSSNHYRIDYRDGTSFVIERQPVRIWCTWSSESTAADTATYLLGPVLAYVLRLRGTLALHASAVARADGALLIAGAPGAGKSTTAALFARRGASVITDDVSAVAWREGAAFVMPGYPRVRLWSDVAEAFWGAPDALPLLTPTWAKRFADVTIVDAPQRIAAIGVITAREPEARVRDVSGADAAIALLRHASMTHALDASMRERELAEVARLASKTRVVEIVAPDDLRRAGEVVDMLSSRA